MTHPLTDKIIDSIVKESNPSLYNDFWIPFQECMRHAYDLGYEDATSIKNIYTINGIPSNDILIPIVTGMCKESPTDVEKHVRKYYNEVWFSEKCNSHRGNDNKLNHHIRSIRARFGITM